MIKLNFGNKFTDLGLLIMRLGLGLAFIFIHGLSKIKGGPEVWSKLGKPMSNLGIDFLPGFWGFMAAFSEFIVPFFIIAGFFFRPATFLLAGTMFVAMVMHLTNLDPWNKVAYPMELLIVFTGLFFIGPGRYSVDYLVNRKKEVNQ